MNKETAIQILKLDDIIERMRMYGHVSNKDIEELKQLKITLYENYCNRLRRNDS